MAKKEMPRWWTFARAMVRQYPKLCTDPPKSPDDIKDREAVAKAIEMTRQSRNGEDHLALIRAVYWGRKQRRVKEAGIQLYISEATAKRWHGDFIKLVGKCWGFGI